MIDSHVHFWEYNEIRDSWINENMEVIRHNFLPENIDPLLTANGVEGIVVVQADQSEEETNFLVKLSKQYVKILGIVGWIDLQSNKLEEKLEKYREQKIIKGWRHIVQAEPAGFLSNPQFIQNVKILGNNNYTYGVLVYHFQLPEAVDFVSKLPNQPLILNHLGKPDLKSLEFFNWKKQITELAKFENVYCKLSGLVTEANTGAWNKEMLWPYLDLAVEKFGLNRIMFGSDWPVMLLNSNYAEWLSVVKEYTQQFTQYEQNLILSENARKCYNL
jgi:L-fuconolactonase